MHAIGRLVQGMVEETRAGWSWMVLLSAEEAPGWLAFHGPKGMRGGEGEVAVPLAGEPRLELWPAGGANQPLIMVPVGVNRPFRENVRQLFGRPMDPRAGWLLLLSLLHALDEAARARQRVPTVGDALLATGTPTLPAWASALTLGDLESALLRARL